MCWSVVLLTLLVATVLSFALTAARAQGDPTQRCLAEIAALGAWPDWHARLWRPSFDDPLGEQAFLARARELRSCLGPAWQPGPPERDPLWPLDWLLAFSEAATVPQLRADTADGILDAARQAGRQPVLTYRLDPATLEDAGLRRLREDVGLALPPGPIYLMLVSQPAAAPPVVAAQLEDSTVAGFTLCRYVVVRLPVEGVPAPGSEAWQRGVRTLRHELVHAEVGGATGCQDSLPVWFHEGMAIHFSGSGSAVTVINGLPVAVSAEAYEQYEANFRYLEAALGPERFHTLLRDVIVQDDASLLLAAAGLSSEQALEASADAWEQDRARWLPLPWIIGTGAALLGLLAFIVVVLPWLGARARPAPAPALPSGLPVDRRSPVAPPHSLPRPEAPAPARPPPAQEAPAPVVPAPDAALRAALKRFIAADGSLAELERMLIAERALFGAQAITLLEQALPRMQSEELRRRAERRLRLLRRCAAVGVTRAIGEAEVLSIAQHARAALQSGDPQRQAELAARLEQVAARPERVPGASAFAGLLARRLRGEEVRTDVAALPPEFQGLYARVTAGVG